MKKVLHYYSAMAWACLLIGCTATTSTFGQNSLRLQKEIPLAGVKGRVDHLDIDEKDKLVFVAALGNNTVEVVNLTSAKVAHTISGLSEPQGVAYISKHHELFVANGGTGECSFYNTDTWQKTSSIMYSDDADDVRYDAASDMIYVGYGSGGIGIINAETHKQVGNIKLPAHPESFQLDAKAGKLWVNLPGSGEIAMADLRTRKVIAEWKRLFPRGNFPMAYDQAQHRLMVGYRFPAILKVLDSQTGKEIFSSRMVGDVDDFYWDERTKQLLVSGGSGSINIFKDTGNNSFQEVANVKTRSGARTSLWVPDQRLLIVAARESQGQPAALFIYKLVQ